MSRSRTLVNASSGLKQVTVGLVGNTLCNETIRNHVSDSKDVVRMPGIGVRSPA